MFSEALSLVKVFSLLLSDKQVDRNKSDLLYHNLPISVLAHCNNNLSVSTFSSLTQTTIWSLHTDTEPEQTY